MGIVGFTLRGRVDVPVIFESFEEFTREFGGLTPLSLVPLSVQAAFDNGLRKGYCVRVVPPGALTAAVEVDPAGGSNLWFVKCVAPGAWGNAVRVLYEGHPDFLNEDDPTKPYYTRFNYLVQEIDPEIGVHLLKEAYDLIDLDAPATASNSLERFVNDDSVGSKIVRVTRNTAAVNPLTGDPTYIPAELFRVRYEDLATGLVGDGATKRFMFTLADVPVLEGSFSVTDGLQVASDNRLEQLLGDIDPIGMNKINYETGEVDITFSAAPALGIPIKVTYNKLNHSVAFDLVGGFDGPGGGGVIGRAQVSHPSLKAHKRGIFALDKVEDILNVIVPDFAGVALVSRDLVDYANFDFGVTSDRPGRFAILTTPPRLEPVAAIQHLVNDVRRKSRRSAIYYPWVKMFDNEFDGIRLVPPLGHIAGIYARTDLSKTVGKAPAGVDDGQLRGIFALERTLERSEMDILYPRRINPLFTSETVGNAVFGARTLSFDFPWKYINAVRLFVFMEEVFRRDMQQYLFENNGPALWAKVGLTLTGRCIEAFDAGMLAGQNRDEAFFVRVDESNNPQENIDNGLLTADVGLSPFSPAEFILVRVTRNVKPVKQKFGA